MKTLITLSLIGVAVSTCMAQNVVSSPNGRIGVSPQADGIAVTYGSNEAMKISLPHLRVLSADTTTRRVAYDMTTGKRAHCENRYREAAFTGAAGNRYAPDTLTIRVYDDGIAWHTTAGSSTVSVANATSCHLQKWTEPYEALFPESSLPTGRQRWAYPALFEFGPFQMLLSESALPATSAAASLYSYDNMPGTFVIAPEGNRMDGWQTAIIGTPAEVVESTLVNDNSAPAVYAAPWAQPGMASWIYWAHNHGSKDPKIIRQYIDFAVKMKLPYVLIDAEWDEIPAPDSIEELLAYAVKKGVKPMIWYNSSIGWIHGAPGPKFRLNTAEGREREFSWCERNGIRGVKIDFFSGDNTRNIAFMDTLLRDAARHGLMVNFHGATLPRGWQRTYPNLITNEGVYGAEWYNNVPTFTPLAASHNATLPFTRNVVASMDYTPCAFSNSQHPHITTRGHELALLALFESGIQHLADRPESIYAQPREVQKYISTLPTAWDDTRFVCGDPGKYVALARRKGSTWYIAVINGTDGNITVPLDLSRLNLSKKVNATIFTDNASADGWSISHTKSLPSSVNLAPRGGATIVVK